MRKLMFARQQRQSVRVREKEGVLMSEWSTETPFYVRCEFIGNFLCVLEPFGWLACWNIRKWARVLLNSRITSYASSNFNNNLLLSAKTSWISTLNNDDIRKIKQWRCEIPLSRLFYCSLESTFTFSFENKQCYSFIFVPHSRTLLSVQNEKIQIDT